MVQEGRAKNKRQSSGGTDQESLNRSSVFLWTMGHLFLARGRKGVGKTTLGFSFAEYAADVGGKERFADLDGHGHEVLERMPPSVREHVDYTHVRDIETLLTLLREHDPRRHPVVVIDGVSDIQTLAIGYTRNFDFAKVEARQDGHIPSAVDIVKRRLEMDRETVARASSDLEYAVHDAILATAQKTDFTILTQKQVTRPKSDGRTYDKGIPFWEFECDGVFDLWKKGRGPNATYVMRVRDVKFGEPGHRLHDPSYRALSEIYPVLQPTKVDAVAMPAFRDLADKGRAPGAVAPASQRRLAE